MRIPVIAVLLLAGLSVASDSGAQTTAQTRYPDSWSPSAYWLGSAQGSIAENITRFHPGCRSAANFRGSDCVAAAHRLCELRYSKNSFGFIFQRDAENVWVACAPRAWYGDVPYTRLQQLHSQCRSGADSQSPHCVAAVRRYCAEEKSLSGGLVQEVGPTNAVIACFKASRSSDVEYRQLSQFSAGCKGPDSAGSLSCATAAANWCKAHENPATLGLPQEIGPTSMAVACFPASVQVVLVLD
jgi:hypothetical protein